MSEEQKPLDQPITVSNTKNYLILTVVFVSMTILTLVTYALTKQSEPKPQKLTIKEPEKVSSQVITTSSPTPQAFANPFDKSTQYINPFEEYQNPFENIQ